MAYTVKITEENIKKAKSPLVDITVKVVANDGVTDVFTRLITKRYNENAPDFTSLHTATMNEFKKECDKYKTEQTISKSLNFTTSLSIYRYSI